MLHIDQHKSCYMTVAFKSKELDPSGQYTFSLRAPKFTSGSNTSEIFRDRRELEMVKNQHLAGAGCQVKMKMWKLYVWLLICEFSAEAYCADIANGKQIEKQSISTPSSNEDTSEAQTHTEDSSVDSFGDQKSDYGDLYRFSRFVPRDKITSESPTKSKSKNNRKEDYVLKIPLSYLRQYELQRLLRLQEHEEDGDYEKRNTVIPVPRMGRSNDENENDMKHSDNIFQFLNSDQDDLSEEYMQGLLKEITDNTSPLNRNVRSMLLLSAPKSEDTTKEKPVQTFVLPYPRPGRSNKHIKVEKSKIGQLILPYPRPGRSEIQKQHSKMFNGNSNDNKYILPTSRIQRSSLYPMLVNEKDSLVIGDWLSSAKSNPLSSKLNNEKLSEKNIDENEGNTLFVIPYPRPGKRTMFKLRNRNQEPKNSEKEMSDYVLPYPRPGKKSGGEKSTEVLSTKSKETENIDSQNFLLPYPRPGRALANSFYSPNEDFEIITLPYMSADKKFDNIVPYPRTGRSASQDNDASDLLYVDVENDADGFQTSQSDLKNSESSTSSIFRFKRSPSVIPYPRLGRSNVVPYPRPGRSDSVVPYPRLGRSNSVVPYPRIGRSNTVVPYPRLGRSISVVTYPSFGNLKRNSTVVPYPRLGRSDSVVPYPRLGRSESVVPYPRPGRAESVVPYPRLGRSESVVPYPRPGRAESVVPYPRLGRSESVVPYPRPGRSESVVPFPRPGRAESVVPYPRPGRSESVVPYPRPGRSESVVPYPRPGRSSISKPISSNKYDNWILPNIRPGRANFKEDNSNSRKEYYAENLRFQRSLDKDTFSYSDMNSDTLNEINSLSRYDKRTNGQGYVLPHPRVGRSASQDRKKRESVDTDTVIPYPRLGRSQKETIPKETPENQNSVHKLNKHMLSNAENSVYLVPYPRPGRYLK